MYLTTIHALSQLGKQNKSSDVVTETPRKVALLILQGIFHKFSWGN